MKEKINLILKYKDGNSSGLIFYEDDYEFKILKNKPSLLENNVGETFIFVNDKYYMITNQYTLIYEEI